LTRREALGRRHVGEPAQQTIEGRSAVFHCCALVVRGDLLEHPSGSRQRHPNGVPLHEVEGASYSRHRHVRRGRQGLYEVFSQTEAGRHVLMVLADPGGGVWKVVTSREMTDQDRRLYRRERRE